MSEEIRKTVRFSKEDVDYIMDDETLKNWRREYRGTSFSERLREMIRLYKWQKTRIEDLVRQNRALSDNGYQQSDNHADVADK